MLIIIIILTIYTIIDLSINIEQQSIIDLPYICPLLISLNMDYSTINTIRNFGIYFTKLSVLTLNNCNLHDIDGISALPGLVELSLIDNFINDISPLAMHDNLSMLNLIGNNIHDLSFTDTLSSCYKFKSLFITRNPISTAQNYRLIVASLISTLQLLDGVPVDPEAKQKISNGMILEAVSNIYSNEVGDNSNSIVNEKRKEEIPSSLLETGSELTHGSTVVLAGNVAAAMRRRKIENNKEHDSNGTSDMVPFFSEGDITDLHKGSTNKLNEINEEKVKQIRQRPMSAITTSRNEVPATSANTRPQSAVGRSRSSNQFNSAPFKVSSGNCNNNSEKPLTFLPNVSVPSAEKVNKGSSIIHKDIVIRHHNDDSDSNSDSNSDDEYIGISHASRHRLMTSQSRRQGKATKVVNSTPPSSSIKHINATPSSIGDESSVNFSNNDISIISTPEHPIIRISNQSLPMDIDATIPSNDQYGMSLGFNLQGSLAAINQWVDDMDSGDENNHDTPGKNSISQIISKYKKKEEADLNINVINSTELSSGQRVLSREKIISMCNGNIANSAAVNSDNTNVNPTAVTVSASTKCHRVQYVKNNTKLPNKSNNNNDVTIKVLATSLNSDGSSPPRA